MTDADILEDKSHGRLYRLIVILAIFGSFILTIYFAEKGYPPVP